MSKRRNRKVTAQVVELELTGASGDHVIEETESSVNASLSSSGKAVIAYLKTHLWLAAIICFLALGIFGAGLKYLDEDAKREIARRNQKNNLDNQGQSFLNRINPFLPTPTPTPTPQLSKELIYSGSRLLTIEDANANATSPADLAVWRKNGEWWVMGPQNGSVQVTQAWGVSTDKTVPGDYDGDGKTDFAVWRPSDGNWYIVNSSNGTTGQFPFGLNGDIPVPADYDGDGKTDAAVYRNGTWYILRSSDWQYQAAQFGSPLDKPAPADFDGDGKADLAVWNISETKFYSIDSSSGAIQSAVLGTSSTQPVPADYDGDGRANYAVRSGANWVIADSLNQVQTPIPWQLSDDTPVPSDYDGDGKVDLATWRSSNGNWYIKQSSRVGQSDELRQVQWGMSGDTPVPAFYRR